MNRALFLDRDGVINIDKNYVYKIEDFEFVEGIFELVRHFQSKGFLIVVITNQAGIGRGYYTEEDFNKLNEWMLNEFSKRGSNITKVYYCPHHPEHGIGEYKVVCNCRKPKPGMILQAKKDFDIDLKKSVLIGNSESDMEAGKNAGVGKMFLFINESKSIGNIKVKSFLSLFDITEYCQI